MVFAINIVNVFVAIYLYKLGYGILFIALFYAALFLIRLPASYLGALIAARFGPKHGILFANILRIVAMAAFAMGCWRWSRMCLANA